MPTIIFQKMIIEVCGVMMKKKWISLSKKLYENNLLSKKLSQAQLCLKFCMSLPEVSLTIAGMMSEKEVIENSDVLDMKALNKRQIQYIINFNKDNEPFIKISR